jgi:hypothetical protein
VETFVAGREMSSSQLVSKLEITRFEAQGVLDPSMGTGECDKALYRGFIRIAPAISLFL